MANDSNPSRVQDPPSAEPRAVVTMPDGEPVKERPPKDVRRGHI